MQKLHRNVFHAYIQGIVETALEKEMLSEVGFMRQSLPICIFMWVGKANYMRKIRKKMENIGGKIVEITGALGEPWMGKRVWKVSFRFCIRRRLFFLSLCGVFICFLLSFPPDCHCVRLMYGYSILRKLEWGPLCFWPLAFGKKN